MDIGKAFDSLNHDFLSYVLRKFRFDKNFIIWKEIFLKQHSRGLNGGRTTQYLNLERGASEGDQSLHTSHNDVRNFIFYH